jgi:hypothetical protein
MARLSRSSRSRFSARTLPWALAGQAALVLRDHWRSVSPADRARLAELVKQSKGRPMHLTPQQRQEVTNIIKRADIPGLGRDLAPIATRQKGRRRVGVLGRR